MEQVHLKYGTSAVDFEVDGAKSVKYLYENKMRVIEDIKAEFLHCVTDGVIGTKPLKELIAPTDPVTIVISDMTRFWMRQDVICELLVKYLHDEMGVGYDQIAVVVALGTHRKNTAEDRRKLASEFVYDHVASVTDMTVMRRIWYTSVRRPSERVYRSIRWQSAERSSASAVRCTI